MLVEHGGWAGAPLSMALLLRRACALLCRFVTCYLSGTSSSAMDHVDMTTANAPHDCAFYKLCPV
eukprot:m.363864 g.363864  ORF g.363864 m.363864 type:complete len:65 (-) comp20805_c0_seq4:236-430(-)